MTFHLAAWSESIDTSVLAPITAISDPSLTVSGDNIQVPDFSSQYFGGVGIGANIVRAQMQSPSLRRTLNPDIMPLNLLATIEDPPAVAVFPTSPIDLDVGEQLNAHVSEDAAGAARNTVLAFLCDGAISPVNGKMFTVRVTNSDTLSAYEWVNGAMTFDQVLPVGDYAVVGARFQSTGLLAFRFVFQGSTPRPGGIGRNNLDELDLQAQRFGGFGVWGQFESRTPPTVDFLSGSADTAQVGWLDLIRVG